MSMLKNLARRLNGLMFPPIGNELRTLTVLSPNRVAVDRRGYTIAQGIKKKAVVAEGTLLAIHPDAGRGNIFAPMTGTISDLTDDTIVIMKGNVEAQEPMFPKLSIGMPKDQCLMTLKELGVDTVALKNAETVIVNAVTPDPAITWQNSAWTKNANVLADGFALLADLYPDAMLKIAVDEKMPFIIKGYETTKIHDIIYPAGLDALIAAKVTGIEKPKGVLVLPLHLVWQMGTVMLTGRPLTTTLLTIGTTGRAGQFIAPVGTTATEALKAMDITLKNGDALVVNGVMRGESWSNPDRGITAATEGLYVREYGTVPEYSGDGPCVNCGACTQVCPARLEPGRLSRFAEAGMLDDCRKHHIEYCLECGLCTYVCTAIRPVMQYLRIARQRMN